MKASALAAVIAVALYLGLGLVCALLLEGMALWITGGLGLWLAFRLAYALEDALE